MRELAAVIIIITITTAAASNAPPATAACMTCPGCHIGEWQIEKE